jgi:tubulin polyglutamylase TTLL5
LSNYSVQKEGEKYRKNNDASDESSKWSFNQWEDAIREQGHDVKIAQLKVEDLIIKSIISAQDIVANAYDSITGVRNI